MQYIYLNEALLETPLIANSKTKVDFCGNLLSGSCF